MEDEKQKPSLGGLVLLPPKYDGRGEKKKKTEATPGRQPGMVGTPPPFPATRSGRDRRERKIKHRSHPR